MWHKFFLMVCFVLSAVIKGQAPVRFDSIIDKEFVINFDKPEHIIDLQRHLNVFVGHGLDEVDLQVFNLSNGVLLGSVLIELSYSKNEVVTYRDILDYIIKMKNSVPYNRTREIITIKNELEKIPADYENWEEVKSLLQKLDITENSINDFEKYVKAAQNKNDNYLSLFLAFKISKVSEETSGRVDKEVFQELFKNDGLVDFEELLKKSRELKKPLLLDFTGYACVNCKKMEENFFYRPTLFGIIEKDYILVNIYVDDVTIAPEDKWYAPKEGGFYYKVGELNARFQKEQFASNFQPYYIIVNEDGEVLRTLRYTKNYSEVFQFLAPDK